MCTHTHTHTQIHTKEIDSKSIFVSNHSASNLEVNLIIHTQNNVPLTLSELCNLAKADSLFFARFFGSPMVVSSQPFGRPLFFTAGGTFNPTKQFFFVTTQDITGV